MNDLQTVNEIINTAVKDSSYITVIISCGVFILYTLINKVIELYKAKDRNKPMLEMASAIKQVSENVVKLNQVLDKTFQDAEIKEANRITNIITASFNSFKSEIITRVIDIIVHNNIDKNRKLIESNINKIISTEYYNLYSALSAYEVKEINVSTKLKEDWIKEIANAVIAIIYDGQDSIIRIVHLNDKLNILINDYSTFVYNKIFNT